MSELAPIALFTFNRPRHTEHCLNSIHANPEAKNSVLYIFSDGLSANATPHLEKSVAETRKVIRQKKWCKEVIFQESDSNKGLAKSILDGVTAVLNKHGKIIVFEDDNVLSLGTLQYLNAALDLYADEKRVMHISSFMFPVQEPLPETFFYMPTTCSGGWATWKRAWDNLDPDPASLLKKLHDSGQIQRFNLDGAYNFLDHLEANVDGRLSSWAIRWQTSVFLNNGLCLHPGKSLVQNIGFDSGGVHSTKWHKNLFFHESLADHIKVEPLPLEENFQVREAMKRFYHRHFHPGIMKKLNRKIQTLYYQIASRVFPSS